MNRKEYEKASRHSMNNREALENDKQCGCYHCIAIFSPQEVIEWTDEGETALCPHCEVDSIIGESSGYPITGEFLQSMDNFAFGKGE